MKDPASRPLRAVGSWLPVVLVYALILATIPFGTFVAHSLYRILPDPVTERVSMAETVSEIATLPSGLVVRYESGGIGFFDGRERWEVPELPGPCEELGHFRSFDRVVCPMRCEGAAVLFVETSGELSAMHLEPGGEAISGVAIGSRAVVGTQDGRVIIFDDDQLRQSVEVGSEPVVRVRLFSNHVIALLGDRVVILGPELDGSYAVRQTLDLPGRAIELERGTAGRFYAVSEGAVDLYDMSDLASPIYVDRVEAPHELARFKLVVGSLAVATHPDHPASIFRDPGIGRPWWREARGELQGADTCGGGWGGLVCVTGEGSESEVLTFDPYGSRNYVVAGVAGIGGLGLLGFLVAFFYRPPQDWLKRLVWIVIALAAAAWLLKGTLHTPIEALHVLEYGLMGLLLFRAITRELGGGPAAAAVAVGLAWAAGVFDEGVQWAYPTRTGAIEDVWLDTQAAAVGVVIGWLGLRLGREATLLSWGWVALLVAALLPASLGLVHLSAGFGHAHQHEELSWTSAYTTDMLAEREGREEDRELLIRTASMDASDFLRVHGKDPYLHELRVRLNRRDLRLQRGDPEVACAEQRIIDLIFAGTIEGTPFEWGEVDRERCEALDPRVYVSPVGEGRITALRPWQAWALAILASLGLLGVAGWRLRLGAHRPPEV